jgi:hypothetical protein
MPVAGDVGGWREQLKELLGTESDYFEDAYLRRIMVGCMMPDEGGPAP